MSRSLHSYLQLLAVVFVLTSVQHAWAQVGCGGFDGSPSPDGGVTKTANGRLCLNKPGANGRIDVVAYNVADGNSPNNFAIYIEWDDGSNETIAYPSPYITLAGPHNYEVRNIEHNFAPRPCGTRPGAECSYRPRVYLRIAGTTCPSQFGTSPDFFRFNTDDQCSGNMELSERYSSANVFLVCEGAETVVEFQDRTTLNCLPPQELTALNNTQRWRTFEYGTFNNITGTVLIGGASQTFPYTNPSPTPSIAPGPLTTSAPPFANNRTQTITIPATAVANQEFHIRMHYWNVCNPWGTDPSVTRDAIIRVVAQPPAPTVVNQDRCHGDALNPFTMNDPGGRDRVFWYRDNFGVQGAAVTNPISNNSLTFPTNAYPGGAISNTTPGVYRMWVSYRRQVNANGLRCESDAVPVTITIRNPVPSPVFQSGVSPVCNGAAGVGYLLDAAAGILPQGGPTEYLWRVVDNSNNPVADVALTIAPGAQSVTAQFNIANGTFGGAPSIIRKIQARRRFVNAPFCASPWVDYPVTVYRNTNAGTLTGGDDRCEGAPLANMNWAPGVGNIVRWEMSTNGGAWGTVASFGTSTNVDPTSLGLTAITNPTTYDFRVQVQNGNCAMLASNEIRYIIRDNNVVADAGPSPTRIECVPGFPATVALAGNTPGPGVTGTWTRVSGPGTANFSAPGSGNSNVTVSAAGVHVFRWTLDNGTCEAQDEVTITFGAAPGIPAPNDDEFCGLTGTLSAVANTGSETAMWTLLSSTPPGGTVSYVSQSSTTTDVTVNQYGTYVFQLRFTGVACGGFEDRTATVTFFEPSSASTEVDKTVCVDGVLLNPIPITGNIGGGAAAGHWEIATGTGTFTSNNTAVGTDVLAGNPINDQYRPSAADFAAGGVTLRLVATAPTAPVASPCPDVIDVLTITFDRNPSNVGFSVIQPFSVCGPTAQLGAQIPINGTGLWSAVTPGTTIDDPADPQSDVGNLQFAPTANVFTWTVTSVLGVCPPQNIDFTINRINAPAAISQTPPAFCEDAPNSGQHLVDLTTYNAAINNGEPTTVTWYRDAAHLNAVLTPTAEQVSNNETFYVVVSTTGTPACTSQATVTFTIEGKPFVANLNPSLCEDGLGTGVFNGVDLTTYNSGVSLGAANRSVTWYTDAALTTLVGTPTNVNGVANGTRYYARVVNTVTTCFNVAEVTFSINPIPPANPILGPNRVCHDPSTVVFFTVTNVNAGHTYQWSGPFGPSGVAIAPGTTTTDFFLLLQFPNVIPGGVDIEVVETSPNGCPGAPQTIHVDIETQPGALAITGPPEVCAFETDVVFSVPQFPNVTYAWSVPPGASIILGQGTDEIHVNFGNTAGDVTVTPSNSAGCAGTMTSSPVAILNRPILAMLDKTVCSQSLSEINLTVTGTSVPATSFIYKAQTIDAGLFIMNNAPTPPNLASPITIASNHIYNDRFQNITATPLNVRYTISGVSAPSVATARVCEGPNTIITLVINPEPQLDPLLARSVCSDAETGITLVSAVNTFPADRFIFTAINVPAGVFLTSGTLPTPDGTMATLPDGTTHYLADAILNNAWRNTTGSNQTVTYHVLPYSTLLGCAGAPPTPVSVTIYPQTIVDPVTVAPLCNGTPLSVTFQSTNNSDATFRWRVVTYDNWVTVGSPANGVGNIVNLGIVNTSTTQDGTVTFEVWGKNIVTEEDPAGCANPIQTFVVTVNRRTEAEDQLLQACSDTPGGTTFTANLSNLENDINVGAGTPSVQITWYITNPLLGPATAIPPASLAAYVMTDGVPVFAEVLSTLTNCRAVARVEYDVNPSVSLTTTLSDFSTFNLNCYNDKSGQIRIDVTAGTPTFSYRLNMGATTGPWINAGANTYTFSSLDARNDYVVEVQDAKGCIASKAEQLIQPPVMSATLTEVDPISCFLRQDGSLATNVVGGTGTYTQYLLLQTNAVDADNDGIFTGLGAATYNVRITDSNGCKVDSSPLDLMQPDAVEINSVSVLTDANGFNLSCRDAVDGEVALTFSGGNLPPNYTITMTKASDPGNPIIAGTALNNHTFTGLGHGNYSIIAEDAKGCPSLPAAAIIVNPPPFSPGFIGINQAVCDGDNPAQIDQLVPAFGGVGNYQYQWQLSLTGSMNDIEWVDIPLATGTTYDPAVLAQTTYFRRLASSVSVRTGIACQVLGKDNIVQVTVNPLPVVSFNAPSEVCQGESFSLLLGMTGGAAPIEYDYTMGSTTFLNMIGTENTMIPVSNFQAPQTYTLERVKDLNGCLAANVPQTVFVDIIKTNSDFTVLAPAEQCSGGTFNFQWEVEANVKYTWVWSDGTQDVINVGDRPLGSNAISHVFTSGNTQTSTPYPVRLQAENALCSPKFTTKNISVLPSVRLNIIPGDTILCSGESIRFIDQSEGVDIGRWYYRIVGSGEEHDVRPGPVAEVSYQMFNTTTTNPIYYEVVYEASNTEGCGDTYSQELKVYRGITAGILNTPDPPNPFVGGISTVQFTNNSAPLDDGAFEYTWDFDDARATPPTGSGINPITVDYFRAGIKTVKLTAVNILSRDENNTCSSTAIKSINIMLPEVGAAFRATPLASCFPVNVTVENLSPGADTFLWELYDQTGLVGTSNLREPVFRILTPGIYDIYLTASYYSTGQTATISQRGIEVFDVPTALFEMRPNPLYVPDTELQTFNKSARATEYHWDFDDGSTSTEFEPRHFYKLEGKYFVTLVAGHDYGERDVDGDGIMDGRIVCYDTVRNELVALDGGYVKLPNAFTPSVSGSTGGVAGSGTFNDVFLPIARGVEEFQMQIFDRWGNMVFETQDRNVGWDGYDRNHRLMPAGVYVYKLIMRLSNGQRTTKIGDVTLIR